MKAKYTLSYNIWSNVMRLLLVSVVVFLTLIVFQKVFATHSYSKTNTISQYPFLPGVTASAEVKSIRTPGGPNATCSIKSYTTPPTTINIIGWTWWQCDVLDGNDFIVYTSNALPPRATPPASSASSQYGIQFSPDGVKIRSHGVHDFNHNGSNPSPWRPGNVVVWQYVH